MIIQVKLRNIDKGLQKSQTYCPIARAITEDTGKTVAVIENGIVYDLETRSVMGYLPEEVRNKYIKYDHTGFMKPFEFEMQMAYSVGA